MPEDPKSLLKKARAGLEIERWCFTAHEFEHPEDCFGEDPFVAVTEETGVIVLRNGTVTNMWEDGTAGVPDTVQQEADHVEELAKPVYYGNNRAVNGEDEYTEGWRDVWVKDGRFLRWATREESDHALAQSLARNTLE